MNAAPGIKCALQTQGPDAKFKGPADVVKHLYATGGIKSVTRGFGITCARDAVASMAYFSGYEVLKYQFTPAGQSGPNVAGTLVAGGVAGMLNWLVCLPLDVLKTRLQTDLSGKYRGLGHVLQDLLKVEGARALYKGFVPTMTRAFPANAAMFVGYEGTIKLLTAVGLD
jgi:solute carrier family 25 carnitine/acylcarnitine transporter 20/29